MQIHLKMALLSIRFLVVYCNIQMEIVYLTFFFSREKSTAVPEFRRTENKTVYNDSIIRNITATVHHDVYYVIFPTYPHCGVHVCARKQKK